MSELTQIFRVPSTVAGLTQQGMTWEAIEADRLARGLDKRKPAKRATVKVVTFEADRRLPGNLAAHVEQPRKLAGYTVGQAKAARKATMKACPCRLCALTMNPPTTYADAERFGLATIGAESAGVYGRERFEGDAMIVNRAPISDAQSRMNADHEEAFREAARVGVRIVPPLR